MKDIQNAYVENITDVEYSDIMKKSYLDYSMSVIVSRAIPDVRDGLKPVQRRIIYDMGELGTFHDRPYRKSARIVGDTMGKYHPHGDSSIYDALVVMSQEFKKGTELVDGHGNFGSIEGDGAAASRYTEARLKEFSEKVFLEYLGDDTVDFVRNYDDTEKEPEVLPCRLPNILLNGAEGIAVGMATSIPPHNLSDVIDTTVYFMDHPSASSTELLSLLKGPDFPTGGIVSNASDLADIYENGTGRIKVRGKVEYENGNGQEKDRLVVTEIPYTMIGDSIGKFLQSVADLVENRTLPDITDITNQTSKDGIRIVFELKKGADPEYIKNILYRKTKLEDTYGVNMLSVYRGKPEVMGLKEILDAYCGFRIETETRRCRCILRRTEERVEILEGLIRAVDEMDTIIEIFRGSRTIKQSKDCLVSGITDGIRFKTKQCEMKAAGFRFTEQQAEAVLSMKLSRLVGLETEELRKELEKKKKQAEKYMKLLSDVNELKKEIKKDLLALKERFGTGRMTVITDVRTEDVPEREEPETEVVILMDRFNYIHCVDRQSYEKNADTACADFRYSAVSSSRSRVAVICDHGKAHIIKTKDIPAGKLRDKGQPLDNLCNYDSRTERVTGLIPVGDCSQHLFVTSGGGVKAVESSEYDLTRKTVDATKLKDGETIISVIKKDCGGHIVIGTKNGYYIRFRQDEVPVQKRNATGVLGIRLAENDDAVYACGVRSTSDKVIINETVTDAGRVKPMKRGGRGTKIKSVQ